ncbi:MAG: LysR family transcriptional regulator [Oscillospiraceae bacterium]
MDITHLRYVVTLARLRSFSRAAETLYVSQSSLSQQIAKLEKEIGYPLFQRTTKYVHLTPEGTRFLTQAKKVLEEFGALHDQVEATRASMEHTINLGMSVVYRPDAAETVVRFMHTHPEIDVNLTSAWELDLVEMLHSGRIDLALFGVDWENDDLSGMTAIPLHDERVVASMSPLHPLARRESVTLAELAGETLIFTSERSGVRRLVLQRFRRMGIHVTGCMEINDTETRIHYVSQNIGVAFAMDRTHHWEKQQDSLRIPIEPKMVRTYSLVTSNSGAARHPAAIKQLQDFLVQNLKADKPAE